MEQGIRDGTRVMEIVSPDGLERYFDELAAVMQAPNIEEDMRRARMADIQARYSITFHQAHAQELAIRHTLSLGERAAFDGM